MTVIQTGEGERAEKLVMGFPGKVCDGRIGGRDTRLYGGPCIEPGEQGRVKRARPTAEPGRRQLDNSEDGGDCGAGGPGGDGVAGLESERGGQRDRN